MTGWQWALVAGCVCVVLYAALVAWLGATGRRQSARAVTGFVPDCVVLLRGLLADPRVARRHKLALVLLLAYLVSPLDLVPDFIPVAGQLDDVILAGVVLRSVARGAGTGVLRERWPGPPASLDALMRVARLGLR